MERRLRRWIAIGSTLAAFILLYAAAETLMSYLEKRRPHHGHLVAKAGERPASAPRVEEEVQDWPS
jgi:hypothetical protein